MQHNMLLHIMFQTCPLLGHEPVPVPANSSTAETKGYMEKAEDCTAHTVPTSPGRATAEKTCR